MKKIIAKLFKFKTKEQCDNELRDCKKAHHDTLKGYYQKVVDEMARTGTIPPNCDLQLPKKSMVIITLSKEGGYGRITGEEILAKNGRWLRLPDDGAKVMIKYT